MTSVCACSGVPQAVSSPADAMADDVILQLPEIHCAGCIAKAERALSAVAGVRAARVNLSLRRAYVTVDDPADPAGLIDALRSVGIAAGELDPAALTASDDPVGRDLLLRLGVAGFAMMNVMLLSVAVWSGAVDTTRQVFHMLSAMIAVPAVIYAARPFFVGAARSLGAGRLGMDVPIALAIVLAAALSVAEAYSGGHHAWFDAALSLTFFLLVGRALDHGARRSARSAARELAALDVPRATRLTPDGTGEVVRSDALRPGDRVRVVAGMGFPADGYVISGRGDVDRSLMTGESLPVTVGQGDAVEAGETAVSGPFVVEVLRAGTSTTLSRMAAMVATAEQARSRYTSLADRAAALYAPLVHLLALAAFAFWLWMGIGWFAALGIAVAVLIVTCPCALGLAVPAVSVAASGRLFGMGCLVTSPTALERLSEVDTVVFDKTGTLTDALMVAGTPDAAAVSLAMGLAGQSAHPVARAIMEHGTSRGLVAADLTDVSECAGVGMRGRWQGSEVSLGRPSGETGRRVELTGAGREPVVFEVTERFSEGAETMLWGLRNRGYRTILFSGDSEQAVRSLADRLGFDDARSRMTPEQKGTALDRLAAGGAKVLMVGDGLNDAPALAGAHAAVAPGTALDAARASADVICLTGGVSRVPDILDTARKAARRMRENLWLSGLYNVVAVPIAFAGLATPLLAALAMSLSSITVSLNALRIGR